MAWTRKKFITTGIAAAIGIALTDAFWLEKYFIETKEFLLGRSTDTHFDLKVIQVSDLHLRSLNAQLKKLAANINSHKPDLVLFTGDAIDDPKNMLLLDGFLQLIDHSIKKIAITGNWEYWGGIDLELLRRTYAAHNCELLLNNSRQFVIRNKTVSITGVDDLVGGKADIGEAIKEYTPGDYHIILNHCPAYGDTIAEKLKGNIPYDFILSGHTHGGQVSFFGFAPLRPVGSGKYVRGWYKDKNIYVSKGIGTSVLPVRFMARAEIAVFKLLA
jgi:predicted MPP superfamily phosphohydrolase